MKRLKIGIFIDTFFPMIDGVIMVVDNYAKRLSKFADVTVFAPMGRDKNYKDNFDYKVVRCKRLRLIGLDYDLPLPKLDYAFMKEVKNADLDIVHIHSPFSIGKIGVAYAKKHKIPVTATMHSQFKKDFTKATKSKVITNILLKNIMKVFNACDECWAVNSEVAKIFLEYGAKVLPKVQNNGTDIKLIEKESEIQDLIEKYNIKDEKVFLFVGRIHAIKNVFFIAESLKILKKKGFKFKMLFVGAGPDENELKAKVKEYNLTNEVIFVGKITDRYLMAKHYFLADLFLFPSLYDASSLVQIEAACQKTPALFLRGAATAGTVTENVNGFISENSEERYAEKIIEIFNDEELYNRVSEGAFRDLYVSWDMAVEKAYTDYQRLIKDNKK